MAGPDSRRPLGSRDTAWARALARRLAAGRLTPNQISAASMGFAGLAGLAFFGAGQAEGAVRGLLLVAAALGCQARLVCNLMDGMVAVEGGKRTADGAFWNEFPDRVSDTLILIGVGYGFGLPALGWAAAAFAVLTAYVRALGRANGLPADFSGPMAKPQRMAVLTGAAVLAVAEPLWGGQGGLLRAALWLVCLGSLATALRRAVRLVRALKGQG
jgi:phosphatidylglycerophosphate synthase